MAVERIGVSLEAPLLRELDDVVREKGYASRSEALRELIRKGLVRRRIEAGGSVVGTITIVYRHDVGMVTHRVLHRQHDFLDTIRATAHTHLNEETCLEVLIVEGDSRQVAELADRLRTVKGVLFAETVVARPDLR
ncbi:MAG TPA: nickel-responsive transcriptional regulator NikR [Thermoplasmata archaeon]|nr:nickel-responsive transcriptional regulator NikR [Thermoplasmata archaeon]